MRVIELNHLQSGAETKTMMDLGQVVGLKPEMSKAIVTLYPGLTLQKLTETLGAVYNKSPKNLKEIESFAFEWLIKTNQIPRIRIAEDCAEVVETGMEFPIILEKKYYDPHDTFELENEQQLYVKRPAERLADGKYRYWVTLVSGTKGKKVNTSYMTKGKTTKYISNYHPELSERGYNKFMFNIEKHRNYISRHRVGDSFSGDFSKLKKVYMEHAGVYFTMPQFEKDMMDLLYLSFEQSMLLGHGNFDDKGNCLINEEDGRPIPIGEGVVQQVRRFCGHQMYFNFTEKVIKNAINDVVSKLKSKTGNKIVVACNWLLYQQGQDLLDSLLKTRITDNYFYDKKGGKIAVGAEYNAYRYAGNEVTFMWNAALDERYPDKGYGIFLDTGMYDGEPNIQMYTLSGMSFFKGSLKGMGGLSGGDSGDIATTVHGSRVEYMGYRGVKVANPYAAHILEQNVRW